MAAVVHFTFTGFFFVLGITDRFALQDAGAIVLRQVNMPLDLPHLALAATGQVLWGGVMAVALGLFLLFTGKKRALLKGAAFGFIVLITFRNFMVSISVPQGLPPMDAVTTAAYVISHFLWGAFTSFIIVKYVPLEVDTVIVDEIVNNKRRFSFVPAVIGQYKIHIRRCGNLSDH